MDINTDKKIIERTYFTAGVGQESDNSYKLWLNNIDDCSSDVLEDFEEKLQFYLN